MRSDKTNKFAEQEISLIKIKKQGMNHLPSSESNLHSKAAEFGIKTYKTPILDVASLKFIKESKKKDKENKQGDRRIKIKKGQIEGEDLKMTSRTEHQQKNERNRRDKSVQKGKDKKYLINKFNRHQKRSQKLLLI